MKTIKNILVLLFMGLLTYCATAQNGLSVAVLHDAKLLTIGDNKGNAPGTTDMLFNFNMEGKQFNWYYYQLQVQYEHANLQGGYLRRYSVHSMWVFNQLVVPKLKTAVGFGVGCMHREGIGGMFNYSLGADVSYPITKRLELIAKNEWVRRNDLKHPEMRYNLSVGVKYKFFNVL